MGNAASTAYEYAASFGRGSADAATSSWPNFERFFVLDRMKSSGSLNVRYRLRNEVGEALTKFLAEAVTAGVKVTELSLMANWLKSLDQDAFSSCADSKALTEIERLDLCLNELSSSASHKILAKFSSLRILELQRNSLTELPEEVCKLTTLEELNISFNNFSKLPENFYKLKNLRKFKASYNMLTKFDEGLGALSHLQELDLSHNNLWEHSFPDSLADLKELKRLELSFNMMMEFPRGLSALTGLNSLILNQTRTRFGEKGNAGDLTCLVSLTELGLAQIELAAVPTELSSLTNLRKLDLSNNKLTAIPINIVSNLVELRKVNLLSNLLSRMPRGFFELPHIRVISLKGNPIKDEDDALISVALMNGTVSELRQLGRQNKAIVLDDIEAQINAAPHAAIHREQLTKALNRPNGISGVTPIAVPPGTIKDRTLLVDRILGCIFGGALGDSVGLLAEFMTRETAYYFYEEPLTFTQAIPDRHRSRWIPGDWTDDTDQLLLILDALLKTGGKENPKKFARDLLNWMEGGVPEHGDNAGSGLGQHTYNVLKHPFFLDDPHRASYEVWDKGGRVSAANGAVMRTCVTGIPFFWDLQTVMDNARSYGKVTHFDPRCLSSVVAASSIVAMMLQGFDTTSEKGIEAIIAVAQKHAEAELSNATHLDEFRQLLSTKSLRAFSLDAGKAIGYTYKTLGAGIWALRQNNFEAAVTALTLEAGDSDTNGAVAGALLGCKLGYSQLPKRWLDSLPHHDWLMARCYALLDLLDL